MKDRKKQLRRELRELRELREQYDARLLLHVHAPAGGSVAGRAARLRGECFLQRKSPISTMEKKVISVLMFLINRVENIVLF